MNVTQSLTPDPLQPMTSAIGTAIQAAQDGAGDARRAAERFVPAAVQFMGRCVYGTGYALSYGIVFPVCLVAHLVPRKNPVVYGLIDGARAAADLAWEIKGHREAALVGDGLQ